MRDSQPEISGMSGKFFIAFYRTATTQVYPMAIIAALGANDPFIQGNERTKGLISRAWLVLALYRTVEQGGRDIEVKLEKFFCLSGPVRSLGSNRAGSHGDNTSCPRFDGYDGTDFIF